MLHIYSLIVLEQTEFKLTAHRFFHHSFSLIKCDLNVDVLLVTYTGILLALYPVSFSLMCGKYCDELKELKGL